MRTTLIAAALLCLVSAPATATGRSRPEIDADALVARCREMSRQDMESGVTARMREGMANTVECLADEIVRHAGAFFDPRSMTEAEVRQALEDIGASYGKLYWVMYNAHRGCEPGCGTMYHVVHMGALAGLYEEILRDLVRQRNEYRE